MLMGAVNYFFAGRDEVRQDRHRIDLAFGVGHPVLQRLHVVLRLLRIARGDQVAHGGFGEEVDRWVEEQRRHEERDKERQDPRGDGGVPVPRDDAPAEQRGGGTDERREEDPGRWNRPPA